jgi:hypothetical protein
LTKGRVAALLPQFQGCRHRIAREIIVVYFVIAKNGASHGGRQNYKGLFHPTQVLYFLFEKHIYFNKSMVRACQTTVRLDKLLLVAAYIFYRDFILHQVLTAL